MDIASEMVYPLLPLFLTTVLGAQMGVVGLVEGVAEASASLFKVAGGRISDRIGARKPLLLLGYGLPVFFRPILALAAAPWHVLIYRFLDRIGKGLRTAPRDALVAEVATNENFGRAYGVHRAMDSLGATLGPFLAFLLLPVVGFTGVFWLSAIPALMAVATIGFWIKEKPGKPVPLTPFRLEGFSPEYKRFLLVSALFTLGLSSNAFLLLRLKEFGYSDAQTALVYTGYNLLYALASYPLGSLADRIGPRTLVAWGFGAYGAVYLGFAFASRAWQAALLMFLYAGYSAAFEGSSRAYLAKVIPATQKASAIGLYHTLVGLLLFPASAFFGYLWQHYGSTAAFSLGAGLSFAALTLFWALEFRKATAGSVL